VTTRSRPHGTNPAPAIGTFTSHTQDATADNRFNPNAPNVARIYDRLLGGKDNLAADRQAVARLLEAVPEAAVAARDNRAFLGRAVRFLAGEAGVRQFLDIGAGLPTARAVHEIVAGREPPPRVVYVDNDPVVVRHAEALVGGVLGVDAIRADLRQPWDLSPGLPSGP
jgi:S-adenosyl methyltransferase